MNYYPVVIPTLCRYEHFKRCVESLSKNTHAEKTELIIGLDFPLNNEHKDGYNKICNYIPQISGFKKVTVFKREKNYGAEANSKELANYAFSNYDAYIYSEDDNEFSPCFLDFMNQALEKYKYQEKVSTVCGYTQIMHESKQTKGVLFTHDNCAWGMGIWKHKEESLLLIKNNDIVWQSSLAFWKTFLKAPAITTMFAAMMKKGEQWGDVMRSIYSIQHNTYQVRPYTSLVRNWGYDGTGLHCTSIDKEIAKQRISTEKTFKIPSNTEIKNSLSYIEEFCHSKPANILKLIHSVLSDIKFCIKTRISNIQ